MSRKRVGRVSIAESDAVIHLFDRDGLERADQTPRRFDPFQVDPLRAVRESTPTTWRERRKPVFKGQ